jgi:hypothetical protein
MGFWASDRETPAAKSLYRSTFLHDDIFLYDLKFIDSDLKHSGSWRYLLAEPKLLAVSSVLFDPGLLAGVGALRTI